MPGRWAASPGPRSAPWCGRPTTRRRPAGYVPLDAFWHKRGFAPAPGLVGQISWRDLDEATESAKPMQFWTKPLA